MTRRTQAAVSVLVAAVLFWWFFRGVSIGGVLAEIREAGVLGVSAAVLLSLSGFLFRILRWRHLLSPIAAVRLRSLASAVFIGWSVTAILPGRLGEVARAIQLRRREPVPASAVFGTIVLERLIDVWTLVMLVAAVLAFAPGAALGSPAATLVAAIRTGAIVVFAALASIGLLGVLVDRLPPAAYSALRRWTTRLPGFLGRTSWTLAERFEAGLTGAVRAGASRGQDASLLRRAIVGHTAVLWAIICGVHLLLFRAFGIDAPVAVVPLLLFLITLGLAVPVPAALGSYHAAVQLGLTALAGADADTAAGYAVVSHAVTLGPPALIGLTLIAREGVALSTWTSWIEPSTPVEAPRDRARPGA
jgi:uncharacterized protein (TIRG00374 family)